MFTHARAEYEGAEPLAVDRAAGAAGVAGAEEIHAVPLDVKTFPVVLGAGTPFGCKTVSGNVTPAAPLIDIGIYFFLILWCVSSR
jgi:hypothetical protein